MKRTRKQTEYRVCRRCGDYNQATIVEAGRRWRCGKCGEESGNEDKVARANGVRAYSKKYSAAGGSSYTLKNIPPALFETFQEQCRLRGVSLREALLDLLTQATSAGDLGTQLAGVKAVRAAARKAGVRA